MKILVIALIAAGLYFLYQISFGASQQKYIYCLNQFQYMIEGDATASCEEKKIAAEELLTCIDEVRKEAMIASFMYAPSKTKEQVNTVVTSHNVECPRKTVRPPNEALYLSN